MRKSNGHSVIEIGISVILLIVLGLLATNIYVIHLARTYNDRVCHDSIVLAAKAALDGKDTDSVMQAARRGMDNCGLGGFFVNHPQFTKFNDTYDKSTNQRVVHIQTRTRVRIPVPILVVNNDPTGDSRFLEVTSTYVYKINNPKKLSSTGKEK